MKTRHCDVPHPVGGEVESRYLSVVQEMSPCTLPELKEGQRRETRKSVRPKPSTADFSS